MRRFSLLLVVVSVIEAKKNPYPFTYLVPYDVLLKYMEVEEQSAFQYDAEISFHYYLYQNGQKNEILSWHYASSADVNEKIKGNVVYFNQEEYDTYEAFLSKIDKTKLICIELIDVNSAFLQEFKKSHPELDVAGYIESNHLK